MKFQKMFLISVLIPTVAITIYLLFIANEKFSSRAVVAIKQSNKESLMSQVSLLSGLTGGSPDSKKDAKSLDEFIKSEKIFLDLDKKFQLKKIFTDSKTTNFYERLSPSDKKEKFIELYVSQLDVEFDDEFGVINISFQSHDPELSKNIMIFLIAEIESRLNELNFKNVSRELAFVESELKKNDGTIRFSENQILSFQNKNNLISPEIDIKRTETVLAEFEGKILASKAELLLKKTSLSETNPEYIALKSYINSLEQEKANYSKQMFGTQSKNALNSLSRDFSHLDADVKLRQEIYKQNALALESLKIDAIKKNKVLEILLEPTVSETRSFPIFFTIIPTIFIVLFIFMLLFIFIKSIINEHKDSF